MLVKEATPPQKKRGQIFPCTQYFYNILSDEKIILNSKTLYVNTIKIACSIQHKCRNFSKSMDKWAKQIQIWTWSVIQQYKEIPVNHINGSKQWRNDSIGMTNRMMGNTAYPGHFMVETWKYWSICHLFHATIMPISITEQLSSVVRFQYNTTTKYPQLTTVLF